MSEIGFLEKKRKVGCVLRVAARVGVGVGVIGRVLGKEW